MHFVPNVAESNLIDKFISYVGGAEYVLFRMTATMHKKCIIDASDPFRILLKNSKLLDYSKLGRGRENGEELSIEVICGDYRCNHKTSFYRPKTKDGDPRFWVYGLTKLVSPDDLFLIAHVKKRLVLLPLNESISVFEKALGSFAKSRIRNKATLELLKKVQDINRKGWIKTKRPGDTGIGYTFETLLGIKANPSKKPDYKGIELKCKRTKTPKEKRRRSSSRQQLFSLVPEWGIAGDRKGLVERHGYWDKERKRKALYITISSMPNPQGWNLSINNDMERVDVNRYGNCIVYYKYQSLLEALERKHERTMFVYAMSRKRDLGDKQEEFFYDEVLLCERASFTNFATLISEAAITLDFTIHIKNGRVRDHGFLWKIKGTHIPSLFKRQYKLL